jgi:hypothetical protein
MRFFAYILIASVGMALLQRIVVLLLIALAGVLLWGLFFRPAETFGLLALGLISNLFRWSPWAGVVSLALIALIAWFVRDHE